MRGSLTDFYTLAPTAPVAVNFMPPDFDPAAVARFAAQPLAPEILECEACQWQQCHVSLRAVGQPLRAVCAPFWMPGIPEVAPPHPFDGLQPSPRGGAYTDPEARRAAILAALADGQLLSIYDIVARAGLTYVTTRKYLNLLLREGRVAQGGSQPTGVGSGARVLYCLTEYLPGPPTRQSRKPPCAHAVIERGAENTARLLAALRARGKASAAELAQAVGLTEQSVRMKLNLLAASGQVERAGTEQYARDDNGWFTTRPRGLWRIVDTAATGHAPENASNRPVCVDRSRTRREVARYAGDAGCVTP